MKRIFLILLMATAAAGGFSSCSAVGDVAGAGLSASRSVLGTALSPVRGVVGAVVP